MRINYCAFLVFLGLSATALADEEIIAGLRDQGYYASEKLADKLPLGMLGELRDVFSEVTRVYPGDVGTAHEDAFQQIWDLKVEHRRPQDSDVRVVNALGAMSDVPAAVSNLVDALTLNCFS